MKDLVKKNIVNFETTSKRIQKMKNIGRKGLGFRSKKITDERAIKEKKKKIDNQIKKKINKNKEKKIENEGICEDQFIKVYNQDELVKSKFSGLKKKKIRQF